MHRGVSYNDQELLEALRRLQDDAVRFLYRSYYRVSEHYVLQNQGSSAEAQDIFQDVVIAFIDLVQAHRFRGECSVSTFIYTLTRNRWLNEMKRKGKARLREEKFEQRKDAFIPDTGHWMESYESRKSLMALVERLGETCRKILLAFYFENRSMKEILGDLDYENEQVVRNKKYKCLKQLEQIVKAEPTLTSQLKNSFWYE